MIPISSLIFGMSRILSAFSFTLSLKPLYSRKSVEQQVGGVLLLFIELLENSENNGASKLSVERKVWLL